MYLPLIQFYAQHFQNEKDGFNLLSNGVAIKTLSNLYNTFVSDGDAVSIDQLPQQKIDKYNEIGLKYEREKYPKQKIMQSAYVLELITSTD